VIVVDSMSHEHAGEGGVLDWQEEEFSAWAARDASEDGRLDQAEDGAQAHGAALLQVRAHLILCFRAEEKIEIVKEGRQDEDRAEAVARRP
jgi:hypothetical protein